MYWLWYKTSTSQKLGCFATVVGRAGWFKSLLGCPRPNGDGTSLARRLETKLEAGTLSFINFAAREINCKIVYYGAGLGGKTTNLQYVFDKTNDKNKGKMISLATETDRTLFFDFLPLDLGTVRGFKTRFHLYTEIGRAHV